MTTVAQGHGVPLITADGRGWPLMELNTTRSPRRARCSHSQAREEAAAKAAEHRLARVTSSIELDRHSVQVSLVNGLLIAS